MKLISNFLVKIGAKTLRFAYYWYLGQRKLHVFDAEPPNPVETNFRHELNFFDKEEINEGLLNPQKIGYAILIHERYEYLVDCLETLFSSNYEDLDVTFFLIDDESTDSRIKALLQKYSEREDTEVYFCEKTQSSSGAVTNRALRIMSEFKKFDIYGFGDPDCLYHPEWLVATLALQNWLRDNYKDHKIGMISPYNSVSKDFHNWIDTHSFTKGKFVTKRQMGWPSVIVTPDYLKAVGLMHENTDDENIYTRRLHELDYVNICLFESHLEHIGQQSILNNFRDKAVARADYSWCLRKDGWGPNIYKYRNPSIVRDLLANKFPIKSNVEVDVIVNLNPKDIEILPTCIESLRKHLAHPILDIYVVSDNSLIVQTLCKSLSVVHVNEYDILQTKFPYEKAGKEEVDREGWLFQQMLKLESNKVGEGQHKFIMDADSVLLKQIAFSESGTTFLPVGPYFKEEYMQAYSRIFREDPINLISNVCHSMLINVEHLNFMKNHIEKIHGLPWREAIYANIELTKISSFSEFETYAHFVQRHFPKNYDLATFKILDLSQKRLATLDHLEKNFSGEFHALGFQHWI